jgi:hypothetical protein
MNAVDRDRKAQAPDQSDEVDFLYHLFEMRRDHEEAEKLVDRWRHVIRDELQRMRGDGLDPHIAWLALVMASERVEKPVAPVSGASEVIS